MRRRRTQRCHGRATMDRRSFLAGTMTSGIIAAGPISTTQTLAADLNPAGLTKATIPTPALVVDLEALDANIRKMADYCRQAKCSLRPHAKTHKCPAIAKRQIEAGAIGI